MRAVIGSGCIGSDEQGAWICGACGFRGFWSGLHCIEDRRSGGLSESELACQRQLARAKDALILALGAGKDAGYGSEFSNGLADVLESLNAFRARMEV
jgi:hypothetical protein